MHSILLALCCMISGSVHAASGAPLAGAALELTGASTARAASDAAGFFAVTVSPGEYRLRASLRGYSAVTVAVESGLSSPPAPTVYCETPPAPLVL